MYTVHICSSLCWWVTLCGGASGEEYLYLVLNLMFQETRHSSQRCVLMKERGEGWKGERGKGGERDKGRWKVHVKYYIMYYHQHANIIIICTVCHHFTENP